MYVDVGINGKEVRAMVDTGASHNFVADRIIEKLGLDLSKLNSRVKAVNSEAKPTKGMATVDFHVGSWQGKCELMAVSLDDFDVILGNDFLVAAKVAVMPHLGGLFIADAGSPSFVSGIYENPGKGKPALLSAIRLIDGLEEENYAAGDAVSGETTQDCAEVLKMEESGPLECVQEVAWGDSKKNLRVEQKKAEANTSYCWKKKAVKVKLYLKTCLGCQDQAERMMKKELSLQLTIHGRRGQSLSRNFSLGFSQACGRTSILCVDRLKIHLTTLENYWKDFYEIKLEEAREAVRVLPMTRVKSKKEIAKILDHRSLRQRKKIRRKDNLVQRGGAEREDATSLQDVNLWRFEDELQRYLVTKRWGVDTTRTLLFSSCGGLLRP